ncbi:MAG: 16S rRNA (cytidine(1402)-2'-O)-methyltransferase [Oscillospiraceae bacterium]|nr:16S rRNA (cytidine(1402)-2'-O)-methyltransferase [Oscillospiraceae bacterium]
MSVNPKTLYIVGTPIGNLGDISARAAETLAGVDFIAAEDTRVTIKLLSRLGIRTPMISYRKHNSARCGAEIAARLQNGECAALVCDAGMPAVSDPGESLVALCHDLGIKTVIVPGPCAAVAALSLSGLPAGRFCFEGFLSTASSVRREHLRQLRGETRTMIFYEAPHKLAATLSDLYDALGDREIFIAREMTKLYEQTLRFTLSEAMEYFAATPPKGEFALAVRGADEPESGGERDAEALALARAYVAGGMPLSEAARRAASETGAGKNALYRQLTKES